jgi:H/ACA ribonucleoprotein complex non-core subunit NAF1
LEVKSVLSVILIVFILPVLVEGFPNTVPLDIDSVLFLDQGKLALGKIFDVIGPVSKPIYCIRFNNHEDIISKGIAVGNKVFCAPRTEYSQFVILSQIMTKGSDASWKNDIEPPENLLEYSDDECERKTKKKAKMNRNNQNGEQREFVRGRRYMVGPQGQLGQSQPPNLAYPNFSWHMNIPPPPPNQPQHYPHQY